MYIYNFDSCFTNQTGQYHTFWNITFNFFSPEQKRLLYICSGDVHPLQVNLCISTGLVGESVTHFVQGLLQHSLRLLPPVLGHVAGCLAVEEQQGGRVLVRHLLEDVVGVLQLLSSLEWKRHVRTHLNISSHIHSINILNITWIHLHHLPYKMLTVAPIGLTVWIVCNANRTL